MNWTHCEVASEHLLGGGHAYRAASNLKTKTLFSEFIDYGLLEALICIHWSRVFDSIDESDGI